MRKTTALVAQTSACLSWLGNLSRETLVLQIAEGIAWAHLTYNVKGHSSRWLAERIMVYLEEKRDGKN